MVFKIEIAHSDLAYGLLKREDSRGTRHGEADQGINPTVAGVVSSSSVLLPYPFRETSFVFSRVGGVYACTVNIECSPLVEASPFSYKMGALFRDRWYQIQPVSEGRGYIFPDNQKDCPLIATSSSRNENLFDFYVHLGKGGAAPVPFGGLEDFMANVSLLERVVNTFIESTAISSEGIDSPQDGLCFQLHCL